MMRSVSFLAMLLLVSGMACAAGNAGPEIIDPAEAAKDADFGVQGEYQGEGTLAGVKGPIGVQVIARSKGKFEAFVLKGGLPGEGWAPRRRADPPERSTRGEHHDAQGEGPAGHDRCWHAHPPGPGRQDPGHVEAGGTEEFHIGGKGAGRSRGPV